MGDFFFAIVFAEGVGMNHHGAGGGDGKPAHVQFRVGFTCAKEVPLAVNPYFHPGVIVVGMCPTRGITLAGRDADSA